MKVILNKCYGGFGVSDAGYRLYAQKKGIDLFAYAFEGYSCSRYVRVDKPCNDKSMLNYFTSDFGKHVGKDGLDWKKALYLNEGYRDDPVLIEVVEELGSAADGAYAKLKVVDIPDGLDYVINDYDGIERLHQRVREW